MEKLFIHATNVHRGGGRSLLEALLRGLPETTQVVLSVDSRMPLPETLSRNIVVQRVPPTVIQRLNAERKLAESVATGDVALCFGNLPPLFKLRGRTIVFMQNRYLIEDVSLSEFPFPLRLRLTMERLWLSLKMKHADEFVVQTPTMKRWMEMKTRARIPVRVLPFLAEDSGFSRKGSQPVLPKKKDLDFVYVASGEPYKNHRMLIEAWCLLAQGGIFPSLKLTVDRGHFGELCSWMEEKVAQYRLKVENSGNLPLKQMKRLYAQAGALIYPSTFESFGLPLIEARQAGLVVLASELDYVRDVLDPDETFDPGSAVSIARAVKRFLGIEEPSLPLQSATGFWKQLLEKAA